TASSKRNAPAESQAAVVISSSSRALALKPDARVEKGQRDVRDQHPNDRQQSQEHEKRAGELHVLTLKSPYEQRSRRLERQHDGNDLRAGYDLWQDTADAADEEIERGAERIFHQGFERVKAFGFGGYRVLLLQLIEQIRPDLADHAGRPRRA